MNCTLRGRCFIADHILHEVIVVMGRDKHKILLQKCYLSMNFSTLLLTVLKLCAITKACSGERGMREPQGSREDSAPDAHLINFLPDPNAGIGGMIYVYADYFS